MLRNILAAIVGYVAMAAVQFALFSLLWLTVGALARVRAGFVGGIRRLGTPPGRTGASGRVHRRTGLCQGGA